jgi:ribosomal protein S12 methylthiotransferase accessory factor
MTTYRLPDREPGERFWYPISTGYAVHTDPAAATFGGLAEVVERDAIAVLWLQRLSLPFLPASAVDAQTGRLLEWCGDHFIEAHLFDATTDLGLPVVYSLLRSPHDPVLHTLVGAGTGLTYAEAALKALLEAIGLRTSLSTKAEPPASYADFHSVLDGTRYMGARERADVFDFLLTPDELRPASTERGAYAADPQQATDRLVGAVNAAGMEAVVVDRTNDELAELGLTAVCVIVPGLQPMSLQPLAQFREHPRLHTAPGRMGHRALAPEQLNPLPQPFG